MDLDTEARARSQSVADLQVEALDQYLAKSGASRARWFKSKAFTGEQTAAIVERLEELLEESLGRTVEIVGDLQYALAKHGLGTEPWKALVRELRTQEQRTADLGRQLSVVGDRRLEHRFGQFVRLGDLVLELRQRRPELFRRPA